MSASHTALRCLGHPASLLSIGLLLLNDHVLKVVGPSWLTGKLSDFAGLFFFPFVLAVLLSLLLDPLRVPPRRIARVAFGLTAAWFALIKTAPPLNALTTNLASRLVGSAAQIVLDPTDLIALVALWPAWRMWARVESSPGTGWQRWLALGAASLATMATSFPPVHYVERLTVVDGELYAGYTEGGSGQQYVARSADGGRTWRQVHNPRPSTTDAIHHSVARPLVVCEPSDARVCYRIAGHEQVERSTDVGRTWQVDWSIPFDRRAYMDRFRSGAKRIDMGPYDMAFFDENGMHSLIVAMGNEGVLVRSPDGAWQRYGMLSAQPTPLFAGGFEDAVTVVASETAIWLLIGFVALVVFSFRSWRMILDRLEMPRNDDRRRVMRPFLFTVGWTIGWLTLYILRLSESTGFGLMGGSLFGFLGPDVLLWPIVLAPIGLLTAWRRVAQLAEASGGRVGKTAGWCILAALGASLLGWMPLLLWTLGTVPVYEIALLLSFAVTVVVLYGGNRAITRLSMAGMPPIGDATP